MNSRENYFWLGFLAGGGNGLMAAGGGAAGLILIFLLVNAVGSFVVPFLQGNFNVFLIVYLFAGLLAFLDRYLPLTLLAKNELIHAISSIVLAITSTVFFLSLYVKLESTGLLSTLVRMANSTLDWQAGFWIAFGKSMLYVLYVVVIFVDWFIVPTLITMGAISLLFMLLGNVIIPNR